MPETKTTKKKSDDCIELKNIKYQTMLINNNMKSYRYFYRTYRPYH